MLASLAARVNAEPTPYPIVPDSLDNTVAALERAFAENDVVVTSGGVSVGDHDHVKPAIERLGGSVDFWKIAVKPGKPFVLGQVGSKPLFGLPGNPVSAAVTFEQFVRPALRKMIGHRSLFRPVVRARLTEKMTKNAGRLHFVRVALESRDDGLHATPTGNQSSGVLTSLIRGVGLVIFPAERENLDVGEEVDVQILEPGFFDRDERGF